jgi:hypothetical protein
MFSVFFRETAKKSLKVNKGFLCVRGQRLIFATSKIRLEPFISAKCNYEIKKTDLNATNKARRCLEASAQNFVRN